LPEALHDLRVELSSVLKVSIREHLDKDPTTQTSTAHIQLYDHTHILNDIEGGAETYSLLARGHTQRGAAEEGTGTASGRSRVESESTGRHFAPAD